jgi:hypothetical protein
MTGEAYLLAGAGRKIVPLLSTLMWAAFGCGATTTGDSLEPIGAGGSDAVFPDTLATAVEFQPADELMLIAGRRTELVVQVTPPGLHTVRFALLGRTENAFLDESVVMTTPDGRATTRLTALAAGSNFTVRAAAGRASGSRAVITFEASIASLDVTPNYGGIRPIDEWVASVHLDTTCSALPGIPYPDGLLQSTGTSTVRINGITAEVPVAVVVRAKQFAGGCRSVTPLRASSVSSVIIDVMDRPMQMEGLSLQLGLGVEPTEAPNPALDELAFRAAGALAGGANDDLAALLDAMSARADDPVAFEAARAAQGWRAALVNGLAPELPGSGLRTLVQNWMRSGIELLEAPNAFQGTLVALPAGTLPLGPTEPESGAGGLPDADATDDVAPARIEAASLSLDSVIGLPPDQTGFEPQNSATTTAETEDFLRLGVTLDWRPSPFFSAAANRAALDRDPERTSAADAMATEFGCDDVASIIVSAGAEPGEAFDDCDEDCVLELCRDAMVDLWSRIAGSNLPAVPWEISGASRARVDDEARPMRVDGNWIGTLDVPDFGTTPIQGSFSGEASD